MFRQDFVKVAQYGNNVKECLFYARQCQRPFIFELACRYNIMIIITIGYSTYLKKYNIL